MPKPKIALNIVDWAYKVDEGNFESCEIMRFLQKYLGHKYDFVLSNRPKYVLYGPFGDSHLDFDESCIRIFTTGENIRTDFNLADYGIGYDLLCFGERHLHYPLYFSCTADLNGALKKHLICDSRPKFCAFVVSNDRADKIRGAFFEALCEYKRVDSGGAWKNNIGGAVSDKDAFLRQYKFNLCFENSAHKGYVTEKLIQAFAAGCVPIYFGDESLCDEKYAKFRPVFNPKAFINVHNFDSIESAIKEIERIDNDKSAFESMRKEPIFRTECLEEFLGAKFANGGGQNNKCDIWSNDIWSAENIEQTAESIINHTEQILADFYDNIFALGTKQIKYGQHLSEYFAQRRSDRMARAWKIRTKNALWKIRCILIAPLKWIRTLWRKMAWRL